MRSFFSKKLATVLHTSVVSRDELRLKSEHRFLPLSLHGNEDSSAKLPASAEFAFYHLDAIPDVAAFEALFDRQLISDQSGAHVDAENNCGYCRPRERRARARASEKARLIRSGECRSLKCNPVCWQVSLGGVGGEFQQKCSKEGGVPKLTGSSSVAFTISFSAWIIWNLSTLLMTRIPFTCMRLTSDVGFWKRRSFNRKLMQKFGPTR